MFGFFYLDLSASISLKRLCVHLKAGYYREESTDSKVIHDTSTRYDINHTVLYLHHHVSEKEHLLGVLPNRLIVRLDHSCPWVHFCDPIQSNPLEVGKFGPNPIQLINLTA